MNNLKDVHYAIFQCKEHVMFGRALDYATSFGSMKHLACTNYFNELCNLTSECAENIRIERDTVIYGKNQYKSSIFRFTCSADDYKSEFWMQKQMFPTNDNTPRGKDFIKWCKDLIDVYGKDPFTIEGE